MPTMTELTGKVGFAPPVIERRFSKCRSAGIELAATLALALALVIAATAVSIGVARAQAFGALTSDNAAPVATSGFLGPFMAGVGGLTAL
jgi:hypothetical protein